MLYWSQLSTMLVNPIDTKELNVSALLDVSIEIRHNMSPPPLPLYRILYYFELPSMKVPTD
jgi:hypothetical protein